MSRVLGSKMFVDPCFECESGFLKSLEVFSNVIMLRHMY